MPFELVETVALLPPAILTVNEAADYLRVHRNTISLLLQRGELPGAKIGGHWRIHKPTLDKFLMGPFAPVKPSLGEEGAADASERP